MDATRERRIRDRARRAWYACHRQWRFARHLGFAGDVPTPLAAAGGLGFGPFVIPPQRMPGRRAD